MTPSRLSRAAFLVAPLLWLSCTPQSRADIAAPALASSQHDALTVTDNCLDAPRGCPKAYLVPGGNFRRSCAELNQCNYVKGEPDSVSPFWLDTFEVDVGRFRQFVAQYDHVSPPSAHAGANPNDPTDGGWDPSWNALLPATAADLTSQMNACRGGTTTWTDTPATNEQKPINCISWLVALDFCIADGGRLPTEAEWDFAAAGGKENRILPWSIPPQNKSFDATRAVFYSFTEPATGPANVGSKPAGRGKFGQFDLAGNILEFVRDGLYSEDDALSEDPLNPYETATCHDCSTALDLTQPFAQVVERGGGWAFTPDALSNLERLSNAALVGADYSGMRCARDVRP